MGLTINQHPTSSVNASNSDVLYVVTSVSSSEPNYQYVCDIKDNDSIRLARLKQRPNLTGVGVFNLGRIIHKNVFGDASLYNVEMFSGATNDLQRYKIFYGEEYAPDVLSPSVVYDGNGNVGNPDVSSSLADWTYFTGISLDRNVELNATLNVTPFFNVNPTPGLITVGFTDIPRSGIDIRETDFHNVALFNGPSFESSPVINDVYELEFEYFDDINAGGSSLGTDSFTNAISTDGASNAPRSVPGGALPTSSFFDIKYKNRITYAQIGPGHNTLPVGTLSYTVGILNLDGDYHDFFTFNISQEENCPYPFYRLMWRNKYGKYDFYNFEGRNKYNNTRIDSQYGKGFVNYSILNSSTDPYNRQNRGTKNYYTEQRQRVTVSTKFLQSEWAEYLEGLFVSDDVYLIEDDGLIPINLISANYNKFTDPRSEKQKSYIIEFEYSNNKRPY